MNKHVHFALCALLLGSLAGCHDAEPTFSVLVPESALACPDTAAGMFVTGRQYVGPENGVPHDSWSMLVRWQGAAATDDARWIEHPVSKQVSDTGLQVPAPHSRWQRGYGPQDPTAGTPAVQLHCLEAGMRLNSWYAPHEPVLGGGWNDMYGYAWSPAKRPKAFSRHGQPSELVLQGLFAVPAASGYMLKGGDWEEIADLNVAPMQVSIQYSMFAYIRDASQPELHPIALLAGIYGNGDGFDQCAQHVSYDYPEGVWFAATTILDPGRCTTDYATTRHTDGHTTNRLFREKTFYRIHYTRENLKNVIAGINAYDCRANACPEQGYSMNPDDYVLDYYGAILETGICHPGVGCSTQFTDRQVSATAYAGNVMALAYQGQAAN